MTDSRIFAPGDVRRICHHLAIEQLYTLLIGQTRSQQDDAEVATSTKLPMLSK